MFNTLDFKALKALMELNEGLPSTVILGDITNKVEDGKLIIDFLFNVKGTTHRDTLVYITMPKHYEVELDILKSLIYFLMEV